MAGVYYTEDGADLEAAFAAEAGAMAWSAWHWLQKELEADELDEGETERSMGWTDRFTLADGQEVTLDFLATWSRGDPEPR